MSSVLVESILSEGEGGGDVLRVGAPFLPQDITKKQAISSKQKKTKKIFLPLDGLFFFPLALIRD